MLSLLSSKNKGPLLRRTSTASTAIDTDAKTTSLNEALEILSDIFPNVECEEFRRMLATFSEESRVHIITEMLLKRSKDGGIPRRRVGVAGQLEPWEKFRTESYTYATKTLLYKEFKGLSKSTIRAVMAENNSDYTRTRATLSEIALKSWRFSFANFFRGTRAVIPAEPPIVDTGCGELDTELFALGKGSREKQILEDRTIAQLLNEAEHAAAEELVECECCYGDYSWDEIAACAEGHFFCHVCLLKSVQEGLYGQGRNLVGEMCSVRCLSSSATPPCEAFVPLELLEAVLPADVFQSLEDKTATESLDRSGLDLIKCPFCPYAEVVPVMTYRLKRSAAAITFITITIIASLIPLALGTVLFTIISILFTVAIRPLFSTETAESVGGWLAGASLRMRVEKAAMKIQRRRRGMLFKCQGRCKRESCVECGKEWAPFHRCFEKEEDGVRIFVEKAMADAVKRTCPLCHVSFVKSDGCNKLTCTCGYVMCYVCRADIRTDGYKHFCQHFRQVPGTPCDECESCDLYVQEDEAAVIKKAAETAETEYFRRFGKPKGWVYRRMENSVLGTVMTAGIPELDVIKTSWLDLLDGQLEKFLEKVLE